MRECEETVARLSGCVANLAALQEAMKEAAALGVSSSIPGTPAAALKARLDGALRWDARFRAFLEAAKRGAGGEGWRAQGGGGAGADEEQPEASGEDKRWSLEQLVAFMGEAAALRVKLDAYAGAVKVLETVQVYSQLLPRCDSHSLSWLCVGAATDTKPTKDPVAALAVMFRCVFPCLRACFGRLGPGKWSGLWCVTSAAARERLLCSCLSSVLSAMGDCMRPCLVSKQMW